MSTQDEPIFTRGPARRPAPRVTDPLLQWATGLQTKDRHIYVGWLVEANRLEALDVAMKQAGYQQVTIKHGSGNLVTHWAVPAAELFFITEGIQSIGEMSGSKDRVGIAFGWRMLPGNRKQSALRARVLLRSLLEVGYTDPLTLSIKGTLTNDLVAALIRQYDVLEALGVFRSQNGKPPIDLPFYACSILLQPGTEVTRGSGGASREIVPMVAGIPNPVTKDYIASQWIKRDWVPFIEDVLDETISWSIAISALIGAEDDSATAKEAI
jgi:hypothetical protein